MNVVILVFKTFVYFQIVLAIVIPILDVVYNWVAVWLNTKGWYRLD